MSNIPATHAISANHVTHLGTSEPTRSHLDHRENLIGTLLSPFKFAPNYLALKDKVTRWIVSIEKLLQGIPEAEWDKKSEIEKEEFIVKALFAEKSNDFKESFRGGLEFFIS